ncbi:MAG: VOC family protein [Fuerstiella sp.]
MIPITGLFETHLTVENLQRSIEFYGDVLRLPLERRFDDRRCAFFRVGPEQDSMLGLWKVGSGPQRMQLPTAFRVDVADLFNACTLLQQAGIEPLDFSGNATSEPAVLCWMPAAAVYFRDPDGHLLEYLAMLPDAPRPDLGILDWASWQQRIGSDAEAGVVPARSGGLL